MEVDAPMHDHQKVALIVICRGKDMIGVDLDCFNDLKNHTDFLPLVPFFLLGLRSPKRGKVLTLYREVGLGLQSHQMMGSVEQVKGEADEACVYNFSPRNVQKLWDFFRAHTFVGTAKDFFFGPFVVRL
jgi:hypothetical protein